MGFSTSISIVILFIGLLTTATASYTTIDRSTEILAEARDTQHERMLDQLNTEITITGITQDGSDLNITVRNDGTTVLNSSTIEIDVLLDGSYTTPSSITPPGVWSPDKSTNIILANENITNRRIKVVVENGESDYYET